MYRMQEDTIDLASYPAQARQSSNSVLRFSHLTYSVPAKAGGDKKLVDDVSLEVRAGELLAIMVRPTQPANFV